MNKFHDLTLLKSKTRTPPKFAWVRWAIPTPLSVGERSSLPSAAPLGLERTVTRRHRQHQDAFVARAKLYIQTTAQINRATAAAALQSQGGAKWSA